MLLLSQQETVLCERSLATKRIMPVLACGLLACAALAGQAPPQGRSLAVEHAVPFGQAQGKLILYGEYLVFVDDGQPANSFVTAKSSIETLSADGATITIQLKDPVRNRSGEARRVSFRALDGDASPVTAWFGARATAAAAATPEQAEPEGAKVFSVRHNHRIESCRRRLIITEDRVNYESTDWVSHSRRWELKQIREIRLPNPYELNVGPFSGPNFKLFLEGSGMDPEACKQPVDRIAAARALKRRGARHG